MTDYRKLKGAPNAFQGREKKDPAKLQELKTPDEGLSSTEARSHLQRDG